MNRSLLSSLCCTLLIISAAVVAEVEDDYDYKEEPIPAVAAKPTPIRSGSPLLRRALPSNRNVGKPSSTTTTTIKPEPVADNEYEYDDEQDGQNNENVVTTTTEAPKKGIRGGVVRPFRSNDDLLAALKRRREQASHGKTSVKIQPISHDSADNEPSPTVAPKKASLAKPTSRKRYNTPRNSQPVEEESAEPSSTARATATNGNRNRFNLRPQRSHLQKANTDTEGQSSETSQQVVQKPRSYRPRSRQ